MKEPLQFSLSVLRMSTVYRFFYKIGSTDVLLYCLFSLVFFHSFLNLSFFLSFCINVLPFFLALHDMTCAVDWELKANYLSIFLSFFLSFCGYLFQYFVLSFPCPNYRSSRNIDCINVDAGTLPERNREHIYTASVNDSPIPPAPSPAPLPPGSCHT